MKGAHKLPNLKIQKYISEDNPLKTARMFNYKESQIKATTHQNLILLPFL